METFVWPDLDPTTLKLAPMELEWIQIEWICEMESNTHRPLYFHRMEDLQLAVF